jgi:hypothetical protein
MAGLLDYMEQMLLDDPAVRQRRDQEMGQAGPGMMDQLLQQQQAPQVQSIVEGDQPPMDMGDFRMDPRVQSAMDEENVPKGMFGIKGTARDILGTLGDTLLMAYRGSDPSYGPQKKQEEQGAILRDFQTDPEGAIRKMASSGNTQAANKMYEMYVKKQQDGQEAQRKLAKDRLDAIPEERKIAAAFIPRMTEPAYGSQKKAFDEFYADRGIPKPFELPDVYDAEALKRLQAFALTPDEYLDNQRADAKDANTEAYRYAGLADKTLNTSIRANLAKNTIDNTSVDNANAAANTEIKREAAKNKGKSGSGGGNTNRKNGDTGNYKLDTPRYLKGADGKMKKVSFGDPLIVRNGNWEAL